MNILHTTEKKVSRAVKTLTHAMTLKSYRKLAVNFLILTINLVIIILYFSLSQAKVMIMPKKEMVTHKLDIPIEAVAGKTVSEPVELTSAFAVGSATEAPAVAQGEIVVHNETQTRRQQLVAKTQFASESGVIVRLKEGITIGPGETITVAAYTDQAGKEGEVEPGRFEIVKLKSDKDKIYGEVKTKFTGGTKQIKTVTQDTLDNARKEAEGKLKDLAREKLAASAPDANDEDFVIEITDFQASAKVGDENLANFTVSAKGTGRVLVYDKEAAKAVLKRDLTQKIPPDKIIGKFDEKSFTANPSSDGKTLAASISANLLPKFSDAVFKKRDIVGMNREELTKHFRKITGIANVEVKFSPFWVRSVPNLEDHVDIEIKKD